MARLVASHNLPPGLSKGRAAATCSRSALIVLRFAAHPGADRTSADVGTVHCRSTTILGRRNADGAFSIDANPRLVETDECRG